MIVLIPANIASCVVRLRAINQSLPRPATPCCHDLSALLCIKGEAKSLPSEWVKYEEKVEDGGKRWSKPHVASLNMHFLMEIRKCILEGVFLTDMECYSISQVVELLLDAWIAKGDLDPDLRQYIRTLCLRGHRHRHDKGRPEDKKKKDMKRNNTNNDLRKQMSGASEYTKLYSRDFFSFNDPCRAGSNQKPFMSARNCVSKKF
ncbi:electrogenic sodium bicarbonate cotransporter 1 [Elysia marginata]|uniref:Electrogenic sodium bicarbonate cotransporter 1 n=1 Tax=Elysia marginata TaxID=1093978 RepID=A0AAV4IB74_9GAST|nr:electrogenic sodium bicarbonate cotransporter 1 [Elysia marginata]